MPCLTLSTFREAVAHVIGELDAGRQPGPTPCHIVINTEFEEALWFSLQGGETVLLNQPLLRPLAELTAMPHWLNQ